MRVSGYGHALAALFAGERTPRTQCTGCWVGPRASLDTDVRGKNLLPVPGIEPRSPGFPVRSQTLYWLSYSDSCSVSIPGRNVDNDLLWSTVDLEKLIITQTVSKLLVFYVPRCFISRWQESTYKRRWNINGVKWKYAELLKEIDWADCGTTFSIYNRQHGWTERLSIYILYVLGSKLAPECVTRCHFFVIFLTASRRIIGLLWNIPRSFRLKALQTDCMWDWGSHCSEDIYVVLVGCNAVWTCK
jgi:hypothetical protein